MARYPGAIWRGPVPNVGGLMQDYRMGVIHIMQGTLAGTDEWFHDSAAQVSAHFGVGEDGTVYQWVDTVSQAWAEADYNGVAISIEHEGFSGQPLTAAQASADVPLMRWLRDTHGLPLDRSHWFGHGELGVAGGNHPDCPGQPILDYLPNLLERALTPDPQPQLEDGMFASLAANKSDDFNATVRYLWNLYRSDPITVDLVGALWWAYNLPAARGGFGGSIDLTMARIVDSAGPHLRPEFAGSV